MKNNNHCQFNRLIIYKNYSCLYHFLGSGEDLEEAYKSLVAIVTNPEWKVKENDKEVAGVEHPGLHMVLKKLAQHDKTNLEAELPTFGQFLTKELNDDAVSWKLVIYSLYNW